MEAIADIIEYSIDNQISDNVTILSDAQIAMSDIGHIGMSS
jgi:hypothetical protein